MRIREGDPLEIFTNREGEVIFKKYSAMENLSQKMQVFADALSRATGKAAVICDRDMIVAVAGISKKEYVDKSISDELSTMMQERVSFVRKASDLKHIPLVTSQDKSAVAVMLPIISESDCVGAVMLLLPESGAVSDELEVKLCTLLASVISGQLSE